MTNNNQLDYSDLESDNETYYYENETYDYDESIPTYEEQQAFIEECARLDALYEAEKSDDDILDDEDRLILLNREIEEVEKTLKPRVEKIGPFTRLRITMDEVQNEFEIYHRKMMDEKNAFMEARRNRQIEAINKYMKMFPHVEVSNLDVEEAYSLLSNHYNYSEKLKREAEERVNRLEEEERMKIAKENMEITRRYNETIRHKKSYNQNNKTSKGCLEEFDAKKSAEARNARRNKAKTLPQPVSRTLPEPKPILSKNEVVQVIFEGVEAVEYVAPMPVKIETECPSCEVRTEVRTESQTEVRSHPQSKSIKRHRKIEKILFLELPVEEEKPTSTTRSRVCNSILKGYKCNYGAECAFAHTEADFTPAMCRFKSCEKADCKFMHSSETKSEYMERSGIVFPAPKVGKIIVSKPYCASISFASCVKTAQPSAVAPAPVLALTPEPQTFSFLNDPEHFPPLGRMTKSNGMKLKLIIPSVLPIQAPIQAPKPQSKPKLQPVQELTCTRACRFVYECFERTGKFGVCRNKKCTYAHTKRELKPNPCMHGDNCRFLYGGERICKFIHPYEEDDSHLNYCLRIGVVLPN